MTLAEKFELGNEEAARIILADPEKYDGLPLVWAQLWLTHHPGRGTARREAEERGVSRPVLATQAKHTETQCELFGQ